jgi:hypothetical protein
VKTPALPVKIWICEDAGDTADRYTCTPLDACTDGCGYREYSSIEEALRYCIITCSECDSYLDDDTRGKIPRYLKENTFFCSGVCREIWTTRVSLNEQARKDLYDCIAAAGLMLLATADTWVERSWPDETAHSCDKLIPHAHLNFSWGTADLYLGSTAHHVSTNLLTWHRNTGLPIPPPKRYGPGGALEGAHNPPEARTQQENNVTLRAWLNTGVYHRDIDLWDSTAERLGLHKKWATLPTRRKKTRRA